MAKIEQKIGIIGDLHLDDRKIGKHKDYFSVCRTIMENIDKMISEQQLTHLIFLGDIFGNTQHILQKQSSRVYFTQFFARWNTQLNGHVYAVKGNHDQGAYTTDFDLLCAAGLIRTPLNLDVGEYRLHFLEYGDTTRKLDIAAGKENVVLAHAQFMIEGQTTFIRVPGGQELSDMQNLAGASLVVCGHIHNPSHVYLTTSIGTQPINLYYPGCPTRPKKEQDLWDKAYMLCLHSYTDTDNPGDPTTTYVTEDAVEIPLPDKTELFVEDGTTDTTETPSGAMDVATLSEVLKDLQEYSLIAQGGYREQVQRLGGKDTDAVDLVISYLDKAEAETCENANPV